MYSGNCSCYWFGHHGFKAWSKLLAEYLVASSATFILWNTKHILKLQRLWIWLDTCYESHFTPIVTWLPYWAWQSDFFPMWLPISKPPLQTPLWKFVSEIKLKHPCTISMELFIVVCADFQINNDVHVRVLINFLRLAYPICLTTWMTGTVIYFHCQTNIALSKNAVSISQQFRQSVLTTNLERVGLLFGCKTCLSFEPPRLELLENAFKPYIHAYIDGHCVTYVRLLWQGLPGLVILPWR